jgi:hypothetical protein
MLRLLTAGGVLLLGLAAIILVVNVVFLGTGIEGARALIQHWFNAIFNFGSSETSQWLIIIAAGLVFGSLVSRPLKEGRF